MIASILYVLYVSYVYITTDSLLIDTVGEWALLVLVLYHHGRDLKVPKCEIFNRSDIQDFYIKKSLSLDFGVKIKIFLQNINGFVRAGKFVTLMLSLSLRRIFLSLGKKNFVELLNNDF